MAITGIRLLHENEWSSPVRAGQTSVVMGNDMRTTDSGAKSPNERSRIVTDGGEPAVDQNARAMVAGDTIIVDESGDRDSIAGEVVLSWVVEQTATDLHYRIVVAPAGSGWVVLRQKRRGINSEWDTAETHDANKKPRLVAMKGVGGDD